MIVFMAVASFAIKAGVNATAATWTVAGTPTDLFGTEWDPTNAANDMTLDGDVYKWSKTDVTLAANAEVKFKVCADHAWDVAYPSADYKLTIPADGKYTVEITFNPSTEAVTATATKTGDAEIANAEITKVQICGATDAAWSNRIDFDLTKGEGEVYTGTLSVAEPTDDVEFKLVVNESSWIGVDQLTMDAPEGMVENMSNGNFKLKNSTAGFASYTFTATWVPGAIAGNGWTLKVAGKDKRTKDVTVSPASGSISEAIATELGGYAAQNITVNLTQDAAYTIESPIESMGNVIINGNGAKIDASALTKPFINYSSVKGAKAKKADDSDSDYTIVENVTIKDVTITGLPQSLLNNSAGKVLFNVNIENDVIEIVGNNTIFAMGNGFANELKMSKSTLWSKDGHAGFLFQAQGRPKDIINGTTTTSWSIDKCTIYQIGKGKKVNNNNSGIKGQKTTFMTLTNSILVDFGSNTNNEVNGWLWGQNGGSNATYGNNTYWSAAVEGAVVPGWTDAGKGGSDQTNTSLTTDPGFNAEKIATGDFTISAGTAQAKFKNGDPRWLVDYVAPEGAGIVKDIEVAPETGADIAAAIAAEKNKIDNELNEVGNITITLAENGDYKLTQPIDAKASVVINGNGSKINASALTGAFINYSSVIGAKAKKADDTDSNYTIVENVTIKDATITGLPQSLIKNGAGNVFFSKVTVDNDVIEIVGNNTIFAMGNGFAGDLQMTNSTLWSKEGHAGFLFQAQGRPKDIINGTTTTSWTVDKCTIYQIGKGKKVNNNNSGIKGQSTTYMTLTNSILVDFGSNTNNEVNGWLWGQNGGANATYEKNTYWSAVTEGAVVPGWTDAGKGGSDQTNTSLTTNPGFDAEKVAAGDFTIGAGSDQAKEKTGDPRWLVEYDPTGINVANVDNAANDNAPAYNLSGIRVGKDYKGIVIKNGRKIVVNKSAF